jgi:hypothetical protein
VSDTSRDRLRDSGTLPTELRLSLDWELWVVEQLLFSGKREGLVHTLAQQGVAPELARERVMEIHASAGYRRLERRIGEARLAAKLQRLQDELERERGVEPGVERGAGGVAVRADIDAATLLAEHWVRSRPLLLTEAVGDMQAVREWSLQSLAARFPALEIEVNVDRLAAARADDTETRARTLTLRELVEQAEAAPSNDFYVVSRNGLFSRPELAPLWDELTALPPFLAAPRFPHGASLRIGHMRARQPRRAQYCARRVRAAACRGALRRPYQSMWRAYHQRPSSIPNRARSPHAPTLGGGAAPSARRRRRHPQGGRRPRPPTEGATARGRACPTMTPEPTARPLRPCVNRARAHSPEPTGLSRDARRRRAAARGPARGRAWRRRPLLAVRYTLQGPRWL